MDADKFCTATFDSVLDTTAPVLSGVPASFTVTAALAAAGAVVTYALPTASDPDDAAGPVTCTPPSGSTFLLGATTVTCTSTDTHGNTGSASFTVTVVPLPAVVPVVLTETITATDTVTVASTLVIVTETITVTDSATAVIVDTTPPVIAGLPGSLTAEATGPGGAVVTFPQPTASDPDDAAGPVTCAPASGSIFALGATTVTCQSVDTHGNLGSAAFTVTVVDTTPPALTLPPTITALPASAAGAAVTFAASAADLVSGAVAVTCSPASGSIFPIGTTTVTCSAREAHGNGATGGFGVVVLNPSQIVARLIADVIARDFRQALALLQNLVAALKRSNVAAACGLPACALTSAMNAFTWPESGGSLRQRTVARGRQHSRLPLAVRRADIRGDLPAGRYVLEVVEQEARVSCHASTAPASNSSAAVSCAVRIPTSECCGASRLAPLSIIGCSCGRPADLGSGHRAPTGREYRHLFRIVRRESLSLPDTPRKRT
jgi:HYR domain-containing protein